MKPIPKTQNEKSPRSAILAQQRRSTSHADACDGAMVMVAKVGVGPTAQHHETGFEIDSRRQAQLDSKLAEKIRIYGAQLAVLTRSSTKEGKEQAEALSMKLEALKKGLHRPTSVVLPPLSSSETTGAREGNRGVPQSARVESKRTEEIKRDTERYKELTATRRPLVAQLREIDYELSALAEKLHLPPPKPPASLPKRLQHMRAKSLEELPPSQL